MKTKYFDIAAALPLILWFCHGTLLGQEKKAFSSYDALVAKSEMIREKVGGELDQALKSVSAGKSVKEKLSLLGEAFKGDVAPPIGFTKLEDFTSAPQTLLPKSIYRDAEYQANIAKIAVDGVSGRAFGLEALPARKKEFPECVAVGRAGDYSASGVFIENDLVLTAAHICDGDPESVPDVVWIGTVTSNCKEAPAKGEYLRVSRYFRHQDYRFINNYKSPAGNDLMLLEIHPEDRHKVKITAQIATDDEITGFGMDPMVTVRAVGFGHSRKDEQGNLKGFGVRRHVTIPLASRNASLYGLFQTQVEGKDILAEFVAASKSELADTCKGDSGGPIYVVTGPADNRAFKLVGITSRATPGSTELCGDGGIYEFLPAYRLWLRDAYQSRSQWMSVE